MDEAEKYQRRLEAIAEKRRQQEEEDRVRREKEDEKIRQQQLKRKSLRDQWLMEGAPPSPSSPSAPSSPGIQPPPLWKEEEEEEEERHADSLPSGNERLSEEKDEEQEDDDRMETAKEAEPKTEMLRGVVVLNGDSKALDMNELEMKSSLQDGPAAMLIKGGEVKEEDHQVNGLLSPPDGVVSTGPEPQLTLGVPDGAEEEEEEEEGILVIRAECVMITDEGDDVVASVGDELQSASGDGDAAAEETARPAAAAAEEDEDPASAQLRPPAEAADGAVVASVPVYSETQPCTVRFEEEVVEAVVLSQDLAAATTTAPCGGQFQEVPLADPRKVVVTEAGRSEEREPLLLTKASERGSDPSDPAASPNNGVGADTRTPPTGGPGDDGKAGKRKNCQCCSLM